MVGIVPVAAFMWTNNRIYRKKQRILILDEATSAMDTKTELLVQKGLAELLKNRTSFIIAHRISTIKNCDRILYVADRNIAESGSHDQLIAARGLYYELYTSQLD